MLQVLESIQSTSQAIYNWQCICHMLHADTQYARSWWWVVAQLATSIEEWAQVQPQQTVHRSKRRSFVASRPRHNSWWRACSTRIELSVECKRREVWSILQRSYGRNGRVFWRHLLLIMHAMNIKEIRYCGVIIDFVPLGNAWQINANLDVFYYWEHIKDKVRDRNYYGPQRCPHHHHSHHRSTRSLQQLH